MCRWFLQPIRGRERSLLLSWRRATPLVFALRVKLNKQEKTSKGNCAVGSGVQGVRVFVEPDDGEQVITSAIRSAHKSIWLEIYILTDRNVIRALEEAANQGLDVRVMLEPHPFGGGPSPSKTMDELAAAGIKTRPTDPSFSLTHLAQFQYVC